MVWYASISYRCQMEGVVCGSAFMRRYDNVIRYIF
jgi:hypothetical protein